MGFLKRFWQPVPTGTSEPVHFSFEDVTAEQLDAHLQLARYGDFLLPDAIRPSFQGSVIPRVGYRHDSFRDANSSNDIPVLAAAVSRQSLFDIFIELLDPLGESVDVVLESSHDSDVDGHVDLYRDDMDLVVLKSILYDFEDLLIADGYTGLAVLRPDIPMEVQFDEHKLLFTYARDIGPFERILQAHGIPRRDDMKLISEGEHLHLTEERFIAQFHEFKMRLGVAE